MSTPTMTTLTPIDAQALARRLKAGELTLIDIREPDEFAREHINGAVSLPLSRLEAGHVALRGVTPWLLFTSDAADEKIGVVRGGRRIIKIKN